MPAQWPIFINNLSKKLASRNSKGPDDIGAFVANEYFNAVKTAQTPFGNIHTPGQKPILEEGFKKAFNALFKSAEPQLEDKSGNPLYADMFEKLPSIDLSSNPDCEFEEWTLTNKDTIDPFEFYPLFHTTCIIPKPKVTETNLFGDIGITSENVDSQPELRYVTMSVIGGDGISPYEFTYSLNGIIQPVLTSDSSGIVKFLAPTDLGKYEYTFISAVDASKKAEIKNINRSASIEIKEDSKAIEIKLETPPAHQLVNPMTEAQQVDEIANRVYYQNDGSKEYLSWVKRLTSHDDFAKKVSKKVLELYNEGAIKMTPINNRLFQEEYDDRPNSIPKTITANAICIFTYIKGIDDKSSLKTENARLKAKLVKYEIEKKKYRDLKIQYINQIANANKKSENVGSINDAYSIMSKCIIDYWKSTAAQPFGAAPPILPCLIPTPGSYIPVYYGDESKLGDDLRKAWNTGKRFKLEPTLETATQAVSAAVAVACAKHLLDLKFIYNGQIPIGVGTAPMIGFSPLVL
jgi:hypothetical protein